MHKCLLPAAILAITLAAPAARANWFSDELPPPNSKPLSEIIKVVEDKGWKTITEVEFDDGYWEIEAHQADGKEIKLKVNPITGEIRQ